MNEFKKTGGLYVSEWNGNDANAGTDPELPKKTIGAVASGVNTIVVGTGKYSETWATDRKLLGDGTVIIDVLGFDIGSGLNNSTNAKNIFFKNVRQFKIASSNALFHEDCIFEIESFGNTSISAFRFLRCVFLTAFEDKTDSNINPVYSTFYNSILLENVTGFGIRYMEYSYVPSGKTITFFATIASASFVGNCFNGIFKRNGIDYELKKLADGSARPDANPAILDLVTIFPDVYTTRGNFAGDPKIVDILNRIVEPDSDLLKKFNATGFIGGASPGSMIAKDGSDPNVFISTLQIDTSTDSWEIASGYSEGFIEIIARLSTNIVKIPKINYVGLLDFAGTAPDNVPDYFPASYSVLSADGLRPNRLCYKLRSSRNLAKPTFESDWDNDSGVLGTTPSVFYDQEYFTIPTITDVSGAKYGNADPLTIGGTPVTISARWVHIKIRLTNLRTY